MLELVELPGRTVMVRHGHTVKARAFVCVDGADQQDTVLMLTSGANPRDMLQEHYWIVEGTDPLRVRVEFFGPEGKDTLPADEKARLTLILRSVWDSVYLSKREEIRDIEGWARERHEARHALLASAVLGRPVFMVGGLVS